MSLYPASVQLLHSNMNDVAKDGKPAKLVTLKNSAGMTATFMDIGATWLSCTLPLVNEHREVLLGIDTMEGFYQQTGYLGATVGRFANRIKNAQFVLNGKNFSISKNQGDHCLHGGVEGFNSRRWEVLELSDQHVVYGLCSPDGDQGFPGKLDVTVCYRLSQVNGVEISYHAHCDQDCPVNLTNHAYFNLQGESDLMDCRDHLLVINADKYLPTNDSGVPISDAVSVDGTGFDFQTKKTIRQDFLKDDHQKSVGGYDHSYLFPEHAGGASLVSIVQSPDEKVKMKVMTTMPAGQLYTGNFLKDCPKRGGKHYTNYAGFAFETQFLPDSPNHPEWSMSDSILKAGDDYRHQTTYQFELS
ncbi:galactose-1-epimerase [Marinomonas flavescens]|uniref:galactose-1-epimerase n=1 Tax=Marinomonas flavescens TaxID=2529379 RepID=UPI001A9FB1F7|nr:galactose-1-epimerase [Marinomonas flavescens]